MAQIKTCLTKRLAGNEMLYRGRPWKKTMLITAANLRVSILLMRRSFCMTDFQVKVATMGEGNNLVDYYDVIFPASKEGDKEAMKSEM